jgi:hypothetical protein
MASPDPSLRKKSSQYSNYLRYSGLAVQLLAAIGLFGWLGYELDSYLNIRFPAFMLLFGFLAFGGMMIQLYRTIKRDNS